MSTEVGSFGIWVSDLFKKIWIRKALTGTLRFSGSLDTEVILEIMYYGVSNP